MYITTVSIIQIFLKFVLNFEAPCIFILGHVIEREPFHTRPIENDSTT